MPLSNFHLRASVAVSDIGQAVAFYEGKLGLQALESGPSAAIPDASRVYGSGGGPALNVYQSLTAGRSSATLATWYVDDIDRGLTSSPPPASDSSDTTSSSTTPRASPLEPAVVASRGSRTRTATRSPSKPTPEFGAGSRGGLCTPRQHPGCVPIAYA